MPDYGDSTFWDSRYKTSLPTLPVFDWYNDYDAVKQVLMPFLKRKEASILHVGCGNSPLPERLYDDGYRRIVNIDISESVVKFMAERNKEKRPEIRFEVCDVTELADFIEDEFDLVIDKGTLDSLVCGQDAMKRAKMMCAQVSRVLRPGGSFVCMSYSAPADREQFLLHDMWDMCIKFCKKPNLRDVKDGVKEKFVVSDYTRPETVGEMASDEASTRGGDGAANEVGEGEDTARDATESTQQAEKNAKLKDAPEDVAKDASAEQDEDKIREPPLSAAPGTTANTTMSDSIEKHSSYHFFYVMTKIPKAEGTSKSAAAASAAPVAPVAAASPAAATAAAADDEDVAGKDGVARASGEGSTSKED